MRRQRHPRRAAAAAALALAVLVTGCASPDAAPGAEGFAASQFAAEPALGFDPVVLVSDLALREPQAVEEPAQIVEAVQAPSALDPAEAPWIREEPPGLSEPVGRIRIPKARIDHPVIEGVQPEQLDVSPGRMPRTAMPGQWGNAVIAGHRSTFGAPFYYVHLLEPGDEIFVDTAIGTHTYEVVSTEIVLPTGMWTVQHRDGAWLTLVSCHPIGSNAQRIIVFARLVDGPNVDLVHAAFTGPYLPPKDPALNVAARASITIPGLWFD